MFIVWRQRPITGKGGGPFLTESTMPDGLRTCWKPLRCDHRGAGRVAWTPLVMLSERISGKPRQRLLHRLPTIRSCCIADAFNRAAWWHDVGLTIEGWEVWRCEEGDYLIRDRSAILSRLREVVPRPTRAGARAFDAFRLPLEAARDAGDDEEDRWWAEQAADQARRRGAEEAERLRREREESRAPSGVSGRPRGDDECFAVLGLGPDVTADEIRRRYRELAMEHHPDRGGDAAAFNRIHQAYEEACRMVIARSSDGPRSSKRGHYDTADWS